MVPVRDKPHFEPQPWDDSETVLPGVCANGGYFLKSDTGPRFCVGGTVARPLATRRESRERFSVLGVEGSGVHCGKGLEEMMLRFAETHHAIQAVDGVVEAVVEENRVRVGAAETVFIPAVKAWKTAAADSIWAKWYVFANGGGIGELLMGVGTPYEWAVVPESEGVQAWDRSKLAGMEKELGFVVV
jgi:hypothetical protein